MVGMTPRLRRIGSQPAATPYQSISPPQIKTLIVGVDGSGRAEQMAKSLLHLPYFADLNLLLVHVIKPQITSSVVTAHWQQGEALLAAVQADFAHTQNIQTRLIEGDPKIVLNHLAQTEPDPLLILGTSQHHRFVAIFENSISQFLFQVARCPLLMVRDEIYLKRIQRIMVALNPSATAQSALQLAIQMAQGIQGAQIQLARVQLDTVETTYDPVIDQAIRQLSRHHLPYQVLRSIGDPGAEIARLSGEANADLLLMGSPDRRPAFARSLPDLDRLFGNSTSDYLRQHSACPVLVVRSDAE